MAEYLKSLIGICDGLNFVLPANMVAETVSGVNVSAVTDAAPWLIGTLNWNGLDVPVVSMEQLVLGRKPRLRGSHVVIVRGTNDIEALPFYGIPVQAMPNDHQLDSTMEIVESSIPDHFNFVTLIARMRGVNCIIPEIEELEKQIVPENA